MRIVVANVMLVIFFADSYEVTGQVNLCDAKRI